jgi:hypothetical protein
MTKKCDGPVEGAPRSHLASPAILLACMIGAISPVRGETSKDIHAMFDAAERDGRVGTARKSRPVDVRPAVPGEIIVTMIGVEERETQSRPAVAGDKVVRNRCPATGNEQYLVAAGTFAERYQGPSGPPDAEGWRPYLPRGPLMRYMRVRATDGAFMFTAPWGEAMVARPGDIIVRDPANRNDTYRVAALSFECTYEVVEAARSRP